MLIIGLNSIEIYENSNKDKKIWLQTKTLNKIYLEIINYLVNYEHYSLDTITNIKKYWQRFYLFKYLIYNMFNFSRYNFNKENLLRKGKNKLHNKTENHRKVNNCQTIIECNIEFSNIKA
ncbi:hypothetical protein [Spiroplasma endosymbiont of Polydrusus formosus]|uniref:hypothetical protein n=1 Tax=Spiroplasma endosymbiont of Polydrusus formosus TaxID=3139326 RepID=UPI0035B567CA